MASPRETIGVLLMAYGSPDSLDDMEAYLLDVRGGRPPSPDLIEEIRERYARIGGRSPLLQRTREQAAALETELNRRCRGSPLKFQAYVGMRHWEPRIPEAVKRMAGDGVRQAVALVMAPHGSQLSTGKYFAALDAAIRESGARLDVWRVESWHDHPGLIGAIAERVREAMERFAGETPYVVFTAHSLPARILEMGDPYDRQLRETAGLLAGRLGLSAGRWQFCYQSAGASQGPWLGPQVEEVVQVLARRGERRLLVVPIGFVCDHVEVLYDLDIACRELAAAEGARLERSPSLNASPTFIAALADIVSATLRETQLWKVS